MSRRHRAHCEVMPVIYLIVGYFVVLLVSLVFFAGAARLRHEEDDAAALAQCRAANLADADVNTERAVVGTAAHAKTSISRATV
jgi:hypothetical protein